MKEISSFSFLKTHIKFLFK